MINLDKYCRLCLSVESVDAELFDNTDENDSLPLCKKVMLFVSIKIRRGDGLPSLLCRPCADRVISILQFKERCENVDASLRKVIKENSRTNQAYWEEQIQSIIQENFLSQSQQLQRNRKLRHSKTPNNVSEDKVDFSAESCMKVETIYQSGDDDVWPDSATSPASPPSPSSAPSPTLNHEPNEDFSNSNGKKRKRRKIDHTCEFCGRKFPRSNHLAQHELTHTAEKPFQCSDCKKSFWYKASLIGHIKQTHTGDVNYTCELCGKGFFKKTELTRHKPTHSNETPHKCPQCGMGFKITKTLKRHIRTVHSAQRSHTCHTCGKSFTQLQTLKVHLVLHSGVKPYVCSYCGKGFSQSAPLKTHVRIHTGEKPYACHTCGDAFSTRSALTAHAFKHEGSLPYPCTRCSSTFKLKRELIQHEQGHDDDESRLGQTESVKLETERSVNKDQIQLQQNQQQQAQVLQPHQQRQYSQHSLPQHQTGNSSSNTVGASMEACNESIPPYQSSGTEIITQAIPASHTVGRPNPPVYHRPQLASTKVSPTASQHARMYPGNNVMQQTQPHSSNQNHSISLMEPDLRSQLQLPSHSQLNDMY